MLMPMLMLLVKLPTCKEGLVLCRWEGTFVVITTVVITRKMDFCFFKLMI